MKKLLPLLFLLACNSPKEEIKVNTFAEEKDSISKLMDQQQKAWNSGDLEEFMVPYLHSEDLRFVGSSGLNKGWQTTLDNYKKSYPTSEKMGTLLFENQEFEGLGNEHFLVIGKWNLFRTSDTLSGYYSLVWQKDEEGWKIIADHSS
jgi:ketosteroid isomerase-like protein